MPDEPLCAECRFAFVDDEGDTCVDCIYDEGRHDGPLGVDWTHIPVTEE